jgi:hypothetical protein
MIDQTTRDPAFNRAVRARTIQMMPSIIKNSAFFIRAVAERTDSQRTGDQVGWLLAGTFSLTSGRTIDIEFAREWVNSREWDDHVVASDQTDERKCLATILQHIIRMEGGFELNVAELINRAHGANLDAMTGASTDTLNRHGIKIIPDGFLISNTHTGIGRMLEKTPWGVNWGRILGRLEGAAKLQQGVYIGGGTSRAVSLPMSYVRE